MGSRKQEMQQKRKMKGIFGMTMKGIPLWSIVQWAWKASPKRSWRTETPGGRATEENEVRRVAGFKTNAELSPSSTDAWFDHVEICVQWMLNGVGKSSHRYKYNWRGEEEEVEKEERGRRGGGGSRLIMSYLEKQKVKIIVLRLGMHSLSVMTIT